MHIHLICLAWMLAFAAQANAQLPPETDAPQVLPDAAARQDAMQRGSAVRQSGNEGQDDAPDESVDPVDAAEVTTQAPSARRELKRELLGAVMPRIRRHQREAVGDER
jgi:hypothetical protein